MVTSGGTENDIRATSNAHEAPHLSSDHEDLDTRMTLHVGKCLDTDQGIRSFRC